MLDALTDNPQDFVEVSGSALAAGVCIEKRWEIPAASAVPLTEPGAVQLNSLPRSVKLRPYDRQQIACRTQELVAVR